MPQIEILFLDSYGPPTDFPSVVLGRWIVGVLFTGTSQSAPTQSVISTLSEK